MVARAINCLYITYCNRNMMYALSIDILRRIYGRALWSLKKNYYICNTLYYISM